MKTLWNNGKTDVVYQLEAALEVVKLAPNVVVTTLLMTAIARYRAANLGKAASPSLPFARSGQRDGKWFTHMNPPVAKDQPNGRVG